MDVCFSGSFPIELSGGFGAPRAYHHLFLKPPTPKNLNPPVKLYVTDWILLYLLSASTHTDDDDNAVRLAPCEVGWAGYSVYCYFASSVKTDWNSARAQCKAKDADLVSIDDSGENAFVRLIS